MRSLRGVPVRFALSAVVGFVVFLAIAASIDAHDQARLVKMRDKCDPVSFNAAFGEGTCVGNGHVTVEEFIAELTRKQEHNAWRFSPDHVRAHPGEHLVARTDGGEVHTFTKVAAFGGGFIPDLNDLTGNPAPAPECLTNPAPFVAPGDSTDTGPLAPGTHRFMCCIHPWMRTEVTVR
jgi:plastocyanin